MEEVIQTRVAPRLVWKAWEDAHESRGLGKLSAGQSGKSPFRYKVLQVVPGESFTIVWKAYFVRLIFRHTVKPAPRGAEIRYDVQIKGFFAWPVRWFLGKKIRSSIYAVLKAMVHRLEK